MQNFLNSAEYAEFKDRCAHQRKIARDNPCYAMEMVQCADFMMHVGPWNLNLVLETYYQPAAWHASISYFRRIGDETVYDKHTGLPLFEAPQDALLCVKDWSKEEKDIANQLLGDLMGPLIPRPDTRVLVNDVVFARHWRILAQEVAQAEALRN